VQEINLYDLIKYYFRYWYVIVLFTLAGLLAGVVYNTYIQQPNYRSSATLFVSNVDQISSTTGSVLINNYMELIKSRRVLEPVISELRLNKDYDQLVGAVSVNNQKDTAIIKLAVVSDSPTSSKDIANATVESFKNQINELYGKENIQVVDSASLPINPYNVRKNLQILLAGAAGLLLAIIIIFFTYDYKLSNGTLNKNKEKQPKKPSAYSRFQANRLAKKRTKKANKVARKQAKATAKAAMVNTDSTKTIPARDPKTGRFAPKKTISSQKGNKKK
jgi:capsular polysaccharide biosynthesis protein